MKIPTSRGHKKSTDYTYKYNKTSDFEKHICSAQYKPFTMPFATCSNNLKTTYFSKEK